MINVVGGSGFIGSAICRRLSKLCPNSFQIFDKNQSIFFSEKVMIADIRNIRSLDASLSEGGQIINLAAEHRDDVSPVSLYQDVNVCGAVNLCNVARNKNINTIVFTSSIAVYGFAKINTNESGKINPYSIKY